ncbi:hypothetical protein [Peribacillus simplex]|uniref:hypothetical protein n=1 Tax=Peribacillus simplex TaxID=1478 RepID=UPI003D2A08D7
MTDVTKTCDGLLPEPREACNLFLSDCKESGINILITETYRSQARQNYLYEQGRIRTGSRLLGHYLAIILQGI